MAGPLIPHDNVRPNIADVVTKNFVIMDGVTSCALWSRHVSTRLRLIPKVKRTYAWTMCFSLEELPTDGARAIRHMNKSGALDGIIMLLKRGIQSLRIREIILKVCEQIISKI